MNRESFFEQVYEVVKEIPLGNVSTYGDIAKRIGFPKNSRLVGTALKYAFHYDIPCHRVVNSSGRLVPSWQEQRLLLEKEGITFIHNHVDLKRHRYDQ